MVLLIFISFSKQYFSTGLFCPCSPLPVALFLMCIYLVSLFLVLVNCTADGQGTTVFHWSQKSKAWWVPWVPWMWTYFQSTLPNMTFSSPCCLRHQAKQRCSSSTMVWLSRRQKHRVSKKCGGQKEDGGVRFSCIRKEANGKEHWLSAVRNCIKIAFGGGFRSCMHGFGDGFGALWQ